MKRRIEGLASKTKASTKARSWKDDDDVVANSPVAAQEDDEDSTERLKKEVAAKLAAARAAKAKARKKPVDSEDELDMALEAALENGGSPDGLPAALDMTGPNPVVWMDVSVAGKPRGRMYFELFRDVVPQTAENFRLLCLGASPGGRSVGYKGSELHKVIPGKLVEGGEFDCSATGDEFKDESFKLTHAKAGVLSMVPAGPDGNASRFQIHLKVAHELDNKQVVFGQVLPTGPAGDASNRLHPLHWIEAMGNPRTGTPREAVVVEDCGQLEPAEAAKLLGGLPKESESQETRYGRGGLRPPKLAEAVQRENLEDVLALTADSLDGWEWEVQKVSRSGEAKDRVGEIEAYLRQLNAVLEEAKYRAGTVQGLGPEGKHGRNAQSQQLRVRDLQETLQKLY